MDPFNIIINLDNQRTTGIDLWVLLTGDNIVNLDETRIEINKPKKLSEIPEAKIQLDGIEGGRLYLIELGDDEAIQLDIAADGTLNKALDPQSSFYYGWIEFSATPQDIGLKRIWSNLSNVDMVALPIALSGKLAKEGQSDDSEDLEFDSWSLGYKVSLNDIRTELKTNVLESIDGAVIDCGKGREKIIAPNIKPDNYPSLEDYIQSLSDNETPLIITTDNTTSRGRVEYRGSFKKTSQPFKNIDTDGNNPDKGELILEITTQDSIQNKLQVFKNYLTDRIVKECDGGKLSFTTSGVTKEFNQNVQPGEEPDEDLRTIINSAFRNILIGINEGYFELSKNNYSTNYPFLTPFPNNRGNQYAQTVFNNSNSYGFPYADSNLKVLVTSTIGQDITLRIFDDNQPSGFSNEEQLSLFANQPQTGQFEFGIGANSGKLGTVKIGNCRYVANQDSAFGGFFPILEDWTKMEFTEPNKFIWVKTPDQKLDNPGKEDVEATDCFLIGPNPSPTNVFTPTWDTENKKLVWGADIQWNDAVDSPAKPSSNTPATPAADLRRVNPNLNNRSNQTLAQRLRELFQRFIFSRRS